MIESLIDKIILYDDKIDIYYKFDKRSPDDNGRDFLFYTEETDASIFFISLSNNLFAVASVITL